MTYTTTLNAIRAHSPCEDGWRKLLTHLGKTKADDEPLAILEIFESNGLDDALWSLRALPAADDNSVRLLACDIAERALRFVPASEPRPANAIAVARRFARGEASDEELAAAMDAAEAAAMDAAAAAMDAAAASWAAWAAARAAWDARDAAWAARAASRTAAIDAERSEQEKIFRKWLAGE